MLVFCLNQLVQRKDQMRSLFTGYNIMPASLTVHM